MTELLNPYIAGAPVTETKMFFGREDIFAWIERSLAGQYADHILVLHGQRRVGKTSVLKQLPHRLPDHYVPVFFDLQGRTHTSLDRFLWWLAREIVRVLKQDRGISAEVPDREAFAQDPEYLETHFLPALRPHLGDRNLLLTFDEFDTLQEPEIRETLGVALVETLRRLMGREGLNFIYSIGSSGRKLENMQASYTEFFKAALYKKVSFLAREDALRLITQPVQGILEYDPEAAERIVGITSGHPYFTQLVCHELFSQCQKTGALRIAQDDVEAVLDDVVERGTVNLKFVWDEASDLEKWGLACLAQREGRMDARAVGEVLHRQRVRFADQDLESALLHLREKDVLTSENDFIIHLLRLWLQKNRPLEQVREELVERNPIASRYLEIGLEYLDAGLEEKALESFHQVLEIDPVNISAQVRIAEVHLHRGRYVEAAAQFERALAIDDEDVAARAGMCEARLALGDQALARGRTKEASAAFQQVLAINPEHGEARQRMADLARQAAEKALAEGRDEEALASFAEALGHTPEDQTLEARVREVRQEKKAKILAGLKAVASHETAARNWAKAIRALEQALEIAPEDRSLADMLQQARASERNDRLRSLPEKARNLTLGEHWDEAFAAWQEYLSLEPPDPQQAQAEIERLKEGQALAATYAQAQIALARKDYDQAIPILKGIVARDETYKESTRLLLQAIEARRRARPRFRFKWKGIRLPRKARLGLAGAVAAVALGAVVFASWDRIAGLWNRGPGATGTPSPVAASDVKVCLLTEADGIADPDYAPIWAAIQAAQTTYGIEVAYVEGTDETNAGERIDTFLGEGCDLIVSYYSPFEEAMLAAATDNPEGRFLVIDAFSDTDLPNVLAVTFKAWEPSFLAGYLAAGVTHTGRVGTFGGMDITPVTAYMDAFARGVEHYNEVHSTEVVVLGRNPTFHTGLFLDSFVDADLASQASKNLLDQGVDVLFPVGGVYVTAAAEAAQGRERAYVIGADLDWAEVYPEYADVLLSSAEKGLEELATEAIRRLVEGEFPGEMLVGNLANGGVHLASFHDLESEVPAELAAEIEALRQDAPALSDPNLPHYSFPYDTITAIVDLPANPDLLYLGTEHAGVYRSEDGGQTWQPSRSGLGGGSITSIAAQDQDLLFASISLAGPYRSTDGGDTWQPIHQGIDLGRLIGWGSTVVADPYRYPAFWFADGGSVYETTDQGDTWTEHERQDFQFTNLAAGPGLDPRQANTLYATSSYEATGEGPSVHVSHDGGQTWTRLFEMDADRIDPGQFALDPREALHQYVSSDSDELGTYASSDGGGTWRQVLDLRCDHLAADPNDAAAAYCAHGTDIWHTVDGGETWQSLTYVAPYEAPASSPVSVLLISSGGARAYYAGTSDGFFISTDQGLTWTEQNSGLPLASLDLTMVSGAGPRLYAADDRGQVARAGVNAFDWEEVSAPSHTSWAIRDDGAIAYATDGEHLWQSSDAGGTWETRSAPPNGVGRLTVHPSVDGMIYSLYGQGQSVALFISSDSGETWEPTTNLYSIDDGSLVFNHGDGSRVYAIGAGELYRSDTYGGNWRPCLSTGSPTSRANSRALVDPDSSDRLLVATRGGGILISEDGCMSWSAANAGLATLFVNTLAVDPYDSDTFYAATDAGAYVSEDDGATWAPLSGWFDADTVVYSLVVDPLNPGVLYAATPEGVFRWELTPEPVPLSSSTQEGRLNAFADPILAAVASQEPVFEYDFSTASPPSGSILGEPTIAGNVFQCQVYGDEACGFGWEGGTSDFVAEYEFINMTPTSEAYVQLIFRESEAESYEFGIGLPEDPSRAAGWALTETSIRTEGNRMILDTGTTEAIAPGLRTRVTVIGLGRRIGVLLNGEPLTLDEEATLTWGNYTLVVKPVSSIAEVHLDNVRFWDLSDYTPPAPTQAASAPSPTATATSSWVTDFAEPILQAIDGRTPYFADDFATPNPLWRTLSGAPLAWSEGSLLIDPLDTGISAGLRGVSFLDFAHSMTLIVVDGAGTITLAWDATHAVETQARVNLRQSGSREWTWGLWGCVRQWCGTIAEGEMTAIEEDRIEALFLKRGGTVALYLDGVPVASADLEIPDDTDTSFRLSVDPGLVIRLDDVRMWELTGIPGLP